MRLPYLQVTQETWAHAKGVAGVLGISDCVAFKLICDLWRWALEEVDEREPVETWGDHRTAHAAKLFAGATDWKGDASLLAEALEAVGLVRPLEPLGLRVTGLERYATALETKSKRSMAGKAGAAARWQKDAIANGKPMANAFERHGKPMAKHGQTQTQTQIDSQNLAGVKQPAKDKALKRERPAAEPNPRWQPMVQALCEDFLAIRHSKYEWNGGGDGKALKALLERHGDEEIRSRWRKGLKGQFSQRVSTVLQLEAKWNDLTDSAGEQPTRKEEPPCVLIR
jgi:hypothetical protein